MEVELTEITIVLEDADGSTSLVRIMTPAGLIEMIGDVRQIGRVLIVDRVHIQGLKPGALGRKGLNAIAQKVMNESDADTLVVLGAVRTTGKNPGRRPSPVTFHRTGPSVRRAD